MVHAAAARNNRAKNENASWPMVDALFSLAIKFHGAYQLLALRLAWPIPSFFLDFTPHDFHPFSVCWWKMCKTSQNSNRNNGYLQTATGLIGVNSTLQQHR